MNLVLSAVFILSGSVLATEQLLGPVVTTINGPIRGEKNPEYYVFKGIQYAESPIGDKRFEPVGLFSEKWTDVKNATEFVTPCIQWRGGFDKPRGVEDCLFLNVYTSQISEEAHLPVFVHFHGGGFTYGSGTFFSPERMLHLYQLVFVTVNYRLGPLGFLSTNDEVVPGNMGLKDQAVALQWVKENIRRFGGNPDSVTLSGFSAGAASVHLHYLSPHSQGLFHRGISHSGCAMNSWVFPENPRDKAEFLAKHVGCENADTRKMVECLKKKPAEDIVDVIPAYFKWVVFPLIPYGPVIEKKSDKPFLASHPETIYRTRKEAQLPWIVAYTDKDGIFPAIETLMNPKYFPEVVNRWEELGPILLDFHETVAPEDFSETMQRILRFYVGDREMLFDDLAQIMTDRLFSSDISRCVRFHSESSPAYLYEFGVPPEFGVVQLYLGRNGKLNGSCHGDDVFTLLRNKFDPRDDQTPEEKEMARLLTDMYISFAEDSHPKLGNVEFGDVHSQGYLSILNIRSLSNISMEKASNIGHENFWRSLPIDEYSVSDLETPPLNQKGEL